MRQISKDITYVGASHLTSALCIITIQVFLARTTDSSLFGLFLVSQAYVNLFEATAIARGGEVAIFCIGRSWDTTSEGKIILHGYANYLRSQELYWNFTVYLLLTLIAWPASHFSSIDFLLSLLLGLAIPLQSSYGVSKGIIIASGKINLQSLFEISYSLSLLTMVVLLTLIWGIQGTAIAYSLVALLKTYLAYLVAKRIIGPSHHHATKPPWERLSYYSILRNLAKNLASQGDVLILGILALPSEIGMYKIARSLSNLSMRLADPMWSVLRPRFLAALREQNLSRIHRLIFLPASGFMLVGYGIALPLLYFYAEPVIAISYGPSYMEAAELLIILFIGTWLHGAITGWLNFFLIISENKKLGSLLLITLSLSILLTSYLAGGDPRRVALGVSFSLIGISLVSWWLAFRTKYLIR